MATTFTPETKIVIPNVTIEKKHVDGVHKAYRLTANEGYVLHSPSADEERDNPMTGETVLYQYYYRQATQNVAQPVSTWDWQAVPENDVPADMIFGGGNNAG